MAEYQWCVCGHVEKKHDNKGKCLAEYGMGRERRRCICGKFRIRKAEGSIAEVSP